VLASLLVASRLASAYALNRSLGQLPLRQFGGGTCRGIDRAAARPFRDTLIGASTAPISAAESYRLP
jgi:hypothetical protein